MKPRLLANENFPAPAVRRLREAGFDVSHVAEGHAGLSDEQVLAIAVTEDRWVLTFDRDYGELLFARRRPAPPCLVYLRLPHYRPEQPADFVLPLLAEPSEWLGFYVTVEGQRLRKRPLLSPV